MKIPARKNFLLGLLLSPALALTIVLTFLTGCSLLDGQADKRLGEACTPEVRLTRAALFTDMMSAHFKSEIPDRVADLDARLQLMAEAVAAGAGVDAAGDAYKLTFVKAVLALAYNRGKDIALGDMDGAVEWLRSIPERAVVLAADINAIEARVQIACAGVAKAG